MKLKRSGISSVQFSLVQTLFYCYSCFLGIRARPKLSLEAIAGSETGVWVHESRGRSQETLKLRGEW